MSRLAYITETQFQDELRFSNQSKKVLDMVHDCLVKAMAVSTVARSYEVSRAVVYKHIETFLKNSQQSLPEMTASELQAALGKYRHDALFMSILKDHLVHGYSCKWIASRLSIPVSKVHEKVRRARVLLDNPQKSGNTKHVREEHPCLYLSHVEMNRFVRHAPRCLSTSTIEMARKYHVQSKTRQQIAAEMGRRASDVFRNLATFAKHYNQYLIVNAEKEARHLAQRSLFSTRVSQ